MISRRKFLWGMGAAGAAVSVPFLASPTIERSRRHVQLWGDGGRSIRIAHLSDFHSSIFNSLAHINRSIDIILAEKPDVVCLTGDFVDDVAPDPDGLAAAIKKLSRVAPTFACMGNHDGGRWLAQRRGPATPDAVVEILQAANVHVLRDRTERISLHERSFFLTGVHDLWSAPIDPSRAGFSPEKTKRIVLAHNPDTKDQLSRETWDLMLSGHTHGGQIRLPYYGGRLTAPVRDDRYIEGLLPWGDRQIHISRGIGAMWGLRINCPAEVSLLEVS